MRHGTVTRHLYNGSTVGPDRFVQDLVVARDGRVRRLRMLLPQARRALEIREQKGDGS
jgi:hypothetical protein